VEWLCKDPHPQRRQPCPSQVRQQGWQFLCVPVNRESPHPCQEIAPRQPRPQHRQHKLRRPGAAALPQGPPSYTAACKNRSTIGCPVSGGEMSMGKHHPPLSSRPDLVKEWLQENELRPREVTLGSKYRAWWECGNPGYAPWQAKAQDRALSGSGCPGCMGQDRLSGKLGL